MAPRRILNGTKANLSALIHASLPVLLALALIHKFDVVDCETKEFDWGDLGVSLANKLPFSGANNNNLRILVSPQRRMTKNFEFDYTNNSQPTSTQGEASYVIPGSSSTYSSQSGSGQASQSSAYSALSASLATLKNRLSARGMSLSSSPGDATSQTHLYQSPGSAYGSTLLSDSQSGQQSQGSAQAQPTYLSVSNQQDPQTAAGGYATAQGQSNDNKTIVLAIPAKINFLTDGRAQSAATKQQSQQQQQQHQQTHAQQLTVMQASGDQQARPDYSAKQLGLISGQDTVSNPGAHIVGRDATGSEQDNHQYVIVNSPPVASSDHSTASGTELLQPTYPGIYQAPPVPTTATHAYTMKYLPTYQSAVPHPTLRKIYSTGETGIGYSEAQIDEQYGRYGGCIDTCNSADVRWRKYSVSKYKFCCSRSTQYDPQFEQPSMDKLSEASKSADDAYYNYLYRRTRSRRSRRPANRYSDRYYKQTSAATSNSGDDGSAGDSATSGEMGRTGGRYDSPYMKYYKSHSTPHGSTDLYDSTSAGTSGKYSSTKERPYRRGRSRDLGSTDLYQNYDSQDDENSSYPDQTIRGGSSGSYGYGSGEESVDDTAGGRYASDGRSNDEDDLRSSSGYGADETDPDPSKNGNITEGSDYPEDSAADKPIEEAEPETTPNYKYTANRRKKQSGKARMRKNSNGKSRRNRKSRINKQASDYTSVSQTNGTEHEPSSSGDHYNLDMGTSNDDEKQQHNKDSTDGSEGIMFSNRLKSMGLNDSAVMNLSKTTMHLKEILLMLEKKAQQKANETASSLTTPTPLTTTSTTSVYPLSLLGSQYTNGAPLQLTTDYLSTDMSLKSPYRYEPSSLSSGLSGLPSTYQSLNMDSFSSLPQFATNQFGLSPKHLNYAAGHHPRKRRTNKHVRYNQLLMAKPHGLTSATSLLQHSAFGKNQLLGSSYYSPLQYPYSYTRANYPSTYASYPYKSLNKSPYLSSLNGNPVSSKLASAASGVHYSDDSRIHGATSIDPLANMASSLRPSTTMRLRSKPFVFQSHVLPIYTRHTILTQPVEKK